MRDPDFDPYDPPKAAVGSAKGEAYAIAPVLGGSPWLTIWTRPRATIRAIVDADPGRAVLPLAMLGGISSTLSRSLQPRAWITPDLTSILIFALVVGIIGGLVANWLMGALLRWTGSWLGGRATVADCRAAIAWGAVPNVANLAYMLVVLGGLGLVAYLANGPGGDATEMVLARVAIRIPQLVLSVWSAVLMVRAVAEVHRFSSWLSLAAFVLATVVLLGGFLVVAMGLAGLSMLARGR